jgi:uncharacterized membrane protein YhaH (DUF805 family)
MNRFHQGTLVSFRGRASRKRFWLLSFGYFLGFMLGAAAFITLITAFDVEPGGPAVTLAAGVIVAFYMVLVWLSSAVAVRRLHDRGKTGYWLLLYYGGPNLTSHVSGLDAAGLVLLVITLGISVWALVDLGILRGESGSNAFGHDPLSSESVPALAAAA